MLGQKQTNPEVLKNEELRKEVLKEALKILTQRNSRSVSMMPKCVKE